jgi:YebC/PmpR family DNA-binding regulatory protein
VGRAFEKRKHTIFARMDRVAKQFTKVGKDIAIAVKSGGTSPDGNPALRRALQNARALNMPKDKVEAAIKKASGHGAANYDIILYEGYGPHGVAMLVEAATDNVTRTVANVRHHFKAHGGNMGTTGSVAFMFQRQGVIRIAPLDSADLAGVDRDELELALIDHGLIALEDGESDKGEPQLLVRCAFNDFGTMQAAIESRGLAPISSQSEYVAQNLTELPEDKLDEVMELVAGLDGDDDVQNVYTNLA